MTYQARWGDGRDVVLPSELAREMEFEPGDSLVVERDGPTLTIKPYRQVVQEVQAAVQAMVPERTGSIVDELLAERRAEAAREEAEFVRWQEARLRG